MIVPSNDTSGIAVLFRPLDSLCNKSYQNHISNRNVRRGVRFDVCLYVMVRIKGREGILILRLETIYNLLRWNMQQMWAAFAILRLRRLIYININTIYNIFYHRYDSVSWHRYDVHILNIVLCYAHSEYYVIILLL